VRDSRDLDDGQAGGGGNRRQAPRGERSHAIAVAVSPLEFGIRLT
jgi:hypothetical protein